MPKEWDVFISHASEDKDDFVRPLAEALAQLGVKVWYDEFTLEVGDSLSRSIDNGLANSRYGVVVISSSFIQKQWPERELRGLVAREVEEEQKVILPIWFGVTKQEVIHFSPTLADTIAIRTEGMNAKEIALSLLKTIRPDIYREHPRADLERMLSGEALHSLQEELEYVRDELAEYLCSYCQAPLSERIYLPDDPDLHGGEIGEEFRCGHRTVDGSTVTPCPSDPSFPRLEEYDFVTKHYPTDERLPYVVFLTPKTKNARYISFEGEPGRTEEEARAKLVEHYNQRARKWSPAQDVRNFFDAI